MKQDFSEFLVPIGTMPLNELKDLVNTRKSAHAEQPMIACIDEVFSYIENYHEIQSVDIIFDNHFWEQIMGLSLQKSCWKQSRRLWKFLSSICKIHLTNI